jgi:hypothetical protein
MGTVAKLDGELTLGPETVNDILFPGAEASVPLSLTPSSKPANASPGFARRAVSSPGAYVTLTGVGAADTVTQGTLLYLRTREAVLVRLTTYDPGGDVASVLPVKGTVIIEFDDVKYLKLLEVKGTATVEWLVTGAQ